jgi:hypothetical protein
MQNDIKPHNKNLTSYRKEAKYLIEHMFHNVFDKEKDHKAISKCLEMYPTWGIFAAHSKEGRKPAKNKKSIFSWGEDVTCLAAVVYYGRDNNFSHILSWGTTVEAPLLLTASIHPGAL